MAIRLHPLSPASLGVLLFCLFATKQVEIVAAQAPPGVREVRSISGMRPLAAPDRGRLIRERARSIQAEDLFQRLGITPQTPRAEIDRIFSMLAVEWEPVQAAAGARRRPARLRARPARARRSVETLTQPAKRDVDLRQRGGAASAQGVASDLAASGAKTAFDGARVCLLRNDLDRAERLARAANRESPDAAAPLALLAWLESLRPANQTVEGTLARIAMLDRAVTADPLCQDALYYRAQLHTRIDDHRSALRDLRTLLEINPGHVDGMRALRLYQMRIRTGSVQMRAVDPNLAARTTSGVMFKRASAPPPARTKKR